MRRLAIAVGLVFAAGGAIAAAPDPPQSPEWDDAAVARAIQRGEEFLWSRWANGHWPEPDADINSSGYYKYGGKTALSLYALLAAGQDQRDKRVVKTLDWLAATRMEGTYAVAFPLAMPLSWAVAQSNGLEHPMFFMTICFAAVMDGSVAGDQCSPISDTTVLSSMCTGCDLMDHVRTQLPQASVAALLAGICWTSVTWFFC